MNLQFLMSTKSISIVENKQEFHLQLTHSINELEVKVRLAAKRALEK